jgi:hypothetical protein
MVVVAMGKYYQEVGLDHIITPNTDLVPSDRTVSTYHGRIFAIGKNWRYWGQNKNGCWLLGGRRQRPFAVLDQRCSRLQTM